MQLIVIGFQVLMYLAALYLGALVASRAFFQMKLWYHAEVTKTLIQMERSEL